MHSRKLFDFIIFSNLFIALCAVLMAAYTTHLFYNSYPSSAFTGFIFFATLASYSIHWYLTDETIEKTASRTYWLSKNKPTHFIFFIISAVGCTVFLLKELSYIKWIIPAVLLTIMYTAPKFPFPPFSYLKKFIIAKTFLLALMWTYVTSALPLLITERAWQSSFTLFFLIRLTLIFPICILFDLRDKDYDKATGVKSLVTILPSRQVKNIFTFLIILNALLIVWSFIETNSFVENFILLIPTVLTYFLCPFATKTNNDYLFYFILDGLMALSPVLYFSTLF